MECLNKKCTITDSEHRMLSCWLCLGLIHFKCSGLPTLTAEATTKYDVLIFVCPNCKKTGAEFYRFFQKRKSIFLKIKNDLMNLSNHATDYENLFEEFPLLDNIKSPPESSPKRRKSARNPNKGNSASSPGASESNSNESDHITPSSSTANSKTAKTTSILSKLNKNNNKSKEKIINADAVNNNPTPIANNSDSQLTENQICVIPQEKKSIFISRFAFETTAEDIDDYIKSKLDRTADINTKKFTYLQPRSITSFKITVPADLFDQLVDPVFWPNNTLVREFIFKENQRKNNIVYLPQRISNNTKN